MAESYERFKAMTSAVTERTKKAVDNLLRAKDSEKLREEHRRAERKADAEESRALMSDARYPRYQRFLAELRSMYSGQLESLASNSKHTDSLSIAILGAKIENLDVLMRRPKQAIKEYEDIEKGLNK